jgi:dipeptidyl-peptidase-4
MKRISLPFLLIALSLYFASTAFAQERITNELIWASAEFSMKSIDGLNSMRDGLNYTSLEESDALGTKIVEYSYATGNEVKVIAHSKGIFNDPQKSIEGYSFSSDETKLLIETESVSIYRYSYFANYYIHDLKTGKTTPLTNFERGGQMLAEFSPDGKKVAFVRDNNLFVVDLSTMKEQQITQDGVRNKIINGATDWVYEEEYALVKGFYWSPNGDRIAFLRFDESDVPTFSMDIFGELYPWQDVFKYPKAGEKNSVVTAHVWDSASNTTYTLDTGKETDQYLPRVVWTKKNDGVCVMRMNRHQNTLEILLSDWNGRKEKNIPTKIIYTDKSNTYIDIYDGLTFLSDNSFIYLSERDGFNHLYHFSANGSVITQITKGAFDVIDYYGVDEKGMNVYYSSSAVSPMEKHVYMSGFKGGYKAPVQWSKSKGSNQAMFSEGFQYCIMMHSDANSPLDIKMIDPKGKEIRSMEDNMALKEKWAKYGMVKKEFFQFKNESGTALNCWMMKPKNFDPTKKYPVLVAIYGGPGSNTVNDSWEGRGFLWHQMLCQEGYIVVSCDPRGTQYRGREFKHSTYMNLGKNETSDFIDFAKYLGQQRYIDAARIGIQGWSYGGYMTSSCMMKGNGIFKAGIAVAPVTNWKYYDSIYTERYMRTPQENNGGYENNSPINFTDQLQGAFLLVHGSADDNVHYQNTMDLTTALVNSNKQFEQFIYPNKNHGIYGGYTRLHLYTKMTNFIKANL